jgi:hypothetical protein
MKLQVNTAGAWKNVVDFPEQRREEVLAALSELRLALREDDPKWSVVDDKGRREWL